MEVIYLFVYLCMLVAVLLYVCHAEERRDFGLSFFGGTPNIPQQRRAAPPPGPPPPLPPAAPPQEAEAAGAIRDEQGRRRRRFGIGQTVISGSPIGVQGDRPLGT